MADEDEDYLSDKFLLVNGAPSSAPKTYVERRQEARRLAAAKNERDRKKSKRQLELEAREEGLSKSLFERAQDEEATGRKNKALSMMMKMGFKPGESLGQGYASTSESATTNRADDDEAEQSPVLPSIDVKGGIGHRVNPLPLNEWAGKTGIGMRKRAASPSATERLAKMVRLAEEAERTNFRDRSRQEYEERRAQGRLAPAQTTCVGLDEKAGRKFNVLWLNPDNADSFPENLIDALDDPVLTIARDRQHAVGSIEGHLKAKMREDTLQPLPAYSENDNEPRTDKADLRESLYSEEQIQEATQFLRLSAMHRLQLVLDYLRQRYAYCFWCGIQYDNQEDMDRDCPGPDEDAH